MWYKLTAEERPWNCALCHCIILGYTNIEPRYAKTMTLMSMCQCARWFNDMNLWQNYWGGGEKQEERLKNMGHALPLKAIDLPELNMNVDVSNPRSSGLPLSSLSSSEWCSLVVIFHDAVGIRTNFWCRPALTSWGCLDTSSEDRSNPGKKTENKVPVAGQKVAKTKLLDEAVKQLLADFCWIKQLPEQPSCLAIASGQRQLRNTLDLLWTSYSNLKSFGDRTQYPREQTEAVPDRSKDNSSTGIIAKNGSRL